MILARVHAIAGAIAAFNGEHLLGDAVAAIERSQPAAHAALIDAHRLYRDARIAYSKRNAGTAEEMFLRAAELFRQGSSPMMNMSRYYAAISAGDQNRREESRQVLDGVRSSIDSQRNRALAAQILGSEAVAANASGAWGISVRSADTGSTTFRALGEARNAAYLDYVAAHAYDMIGAGDVAWARRVRSCAALSEQDRPRLCTNLRSSSATLESFGRIEAATAMIDLAIDEMRGDPAQLTSALTDRARLAVRSGDPARATDDLARAGAAALGVADRKLRETLQASLDVAHAGLPSTAPRDAIVLLGRAIAFFRKSHIDDLLPDAHLQRARAYRASGDAAAAAADYEAALREVDLQRNTIAGDDLRLRFLDTAAQIIEESIDLQLSRGAVAEAFSIADRTRDIHGSLLASGSPVRTSGGRPQTVLLEYVVFPHRIEIFCVERGLLTVETVPAERDAMTQRISALGERMRRRAPVQEINADAAVLFHLLIAPIQSRLTAADEIVIIPDRTLYALPFAALYDESKNQYLVERFAIRLAPSAVMTPFPITAVSLRPALVIADPATTRSPRLPASLEEGQRIAAGYGTTVLSGAEATAARFMELAPQSALIHYAGHADSSRVAPGSSYGALLFAGTGSGQGVLSSAEIERLMLRNHPLVVLAACGTLRGDSVHVGGPSSVARAFLTAGARGVAGTLWEVEDDLAAAMFLRFHESLRAGESPARAVRTAQLEMIHSSNVRQRSPATWAPVELIGS
jgi:CHAT domain-containing protein